MRRSRLDAVSSLAVVALVGRALTRRREPGPEPPGPETSPGKPEPADEKATQPSAGLSLFAGGGVLTVLGAASYAAIRMAYGQFYGEFGVTAEDVGFSRSEILTQGLSGLFLGTYAALPPILDVLLDSRLLLVAVVVAYCGLFFDATRAISGVVLVGTLLVMITLSMTNMLGVVLPQAREAARDAAYGGEAIEGIFVEVRGTEQSILDVRATVATVDWLGVDPPADFAAPALSGCFLNLSHGADKVVLFNVRSQTLYKLPAGQVLVRSQLAEEEVTGDDCGPDSNDRNRMVLDEQDFD